MHKALLSLCLIATYLFSSRVAAQNACASLLQQGVYDQYSMSTGSSSYSGFVSNFCSKYNTYSQDQSDSTSSHQDSVSVGAGYEGMDMNLGFGFGGSNGASLGQVSALGSLLCTSGSTTGSAENAANEAASFIDPSAMQAYEECLDQYAAGLQVTTTIRQIDQAQVTIEVKYVAPTGAPAQTEVTFIEISPSGSWTCYGPLMELTANTSNHMIGTDSVAMSCMREVAAEPFDYQNQSIYAQASTITVMLTSGTVTRSFIPIYVTPPVVIPKPIPPSAMNAFIADALTNQTSADSSLVSSMQTFSAALTSLVQQYTSVIVNTCAQSQIQQQQQYCAQNLPNLSGTMNQLLSNMTTLEQAIALNTEIITYTLQDLANQASDETDSN